MIDSNRRGQVFGLKYRLWLSLYPILFVAGCSTGEVGPGAGPSAGSALDVSAGTGAAAANGSCALAGSVQCGATCADLQTSALNCGACGRSCGTGACAAGSCVCSGDLLACGGGCTDTQTDSANCGSCGQVCAAGSLCQRGLCAAPTPCTPACGVGQECVSGSCRCAVGLSLCGDACVDVRNTPQHCGACGEACASAELCDAGRCVCAPGQTSCVGECADLQTSSRDCGACGTACASGEVCMAGECRAPVGLDGCSGSALDISLQEVAVYQSIKIPLTKGITAIATNQRVSDVVQGRDTLFRVFVKPATGFQARQLSARVTIVNGTVQSQYYAKQTVSKVSTDTDTASTFQIPVPAAQIQADTDYTVELVECAAAGAGTMLEPRFPAQGNAPLETRKTGVLKIHIVPMTANQITADITDATLAVYKAYLEAMYPIERAELTVGKGLTVDYPIQWSAALDQVRQLRRTDRPAADVYYFGLLKPAANFRTYCRSGCTAGIAYVGSATQAATYAGMGLAFGDEASAAVMAHEVGHNHGRNHAPCAPGNQISGVDADYPYAKAITNTWGYDSRKQTLFSPDKTTDIMGYCEPKWISDYTYNGLVERVATINGAPLTLFAADDAAAYRVMLIDELGPRWSQPFDAPDQPFGEPERADALDIDGGIVESITVYRTLVGDDGSATVLVPPAKWGWNAVRTADGVVLPFSAPITVAPPRVQ